MSQEKTITITRTEYNKMENRIYWLEKQLEEANDLIAQLHNQKEDFKKKITHVQKKQKEDLKKFQKVEKDMMDRENLLMEMWKEDKTRIAFNISKLLDTIEESIKEM